VAIGLHMSFDLAAELWDEDDLHIGAGLPQGFTEHALVQHHESVLMVPLGPRKARGATPHRWTDNMSVPSVLARLAFGWGLRTGVAAPLLRDRIGIRTSRGNGRHQTFHEYLADVFGVPEVVVAGTWGPPRPNRKPVLRVFDVTGETMGFAKVGWNELTKELVATEAGFLGTHPRTQTIRLPGLIHFGEWQGRTVSVTGAALGSVPVRSAQRPGPDVMTEVAGLSDRYRTRVDTSPYWLLLRSRIAELDRDSVGKPIQLIEDHGDLELEFGHWHGDWTPWNMNSTDDRPVVWDWERTSGDIPVGFDTIHYLFHSAMSAGRPPETALAGAVGPARADLALLGTRRDDVDVIALLYALEMSARFRATPLPWLDALLGAACASIGSG